MGHTLRMLYDFVVDPAASQPSEETSGAFPLKEKKTFLLAFLRVDDWWETYSLALTDTISCLTMIFATLLVL